MPPVPQLTPDSPLTALLGVGDKRVKMLERLELRTVGDLLLHAPRRYEDRRKFLAIAELKLGEAATVRGKIVAAGVKRWKKGTRAMFECVFDDGSARLHCRWWQMQTWHEDYYSVGREFLIFGKPESLRPRTIDHPETELIEGGEDEFIHVNRIVPVHPLTEGLTARMMRTLVWRALDRCEPLVAEPHPEIVLKNLPPRSNALRMVHFPNEFTDVEFARQRLALDEFIEVQFAMQRRRKKLLANARGLPCAGDNRLIKPFLARLGFALTSAQTKVLKEIRADLGGAHPMRRLLQGDVGSGKTVVAACAALMALESGFHVAIRAPTESLAEQHYRTFCEWLEPLGLGVEARTGSVKTSNIQHSTLNFQGGSAHPASGIQHPASLTIGTHALIEAGFAPERLGLVIIDEQHKFGVAQRERLVRKGAYPHLLVMTATPIPRTLGLTVYGDLDISVIDEMPAGRGRVRTFVRAAEALPKVWKFIRDEIGKGRQVFIVYPRVEDSGAGEVKAVTAEFEKVCAALAPFKIGLLHGRLRADEKERVMTAFRANHLQALLATTVVEVGVNVPNATVMLVENAETFGLAQLHQLRGRIGRGAHESYFIIVASAKTPAAQERLKVLEDTSDGFKIAEADLKLRGPGDLVGAAQSGLPPLRFGNFAEDLHLVERARALVSEALGRE
ncbi:MAG: ATP-dependent DNA helicase RecG [Verrucomicrobia bacterium]|nr:ATP-dependent DNA helicase RecG [Verrucomicrobiota bacterium]